MGVFTALMGRLHRVFNKDPLNLPVINVLGTGTIVVKDLIADVNGTLFDISAITLSDLVTAINGVAGCSASLIGQGTTDILARGIFEDSVDIPGRLVYPQSVLWSEMQTLGWALDDYAITPVADAEKQLYLSSAEDVWLDFWGGYFRIKRLLGEADNVYARRIIHDIISPNQNNLAMEILVEETMTGFDCQILDSAVNRLDFYHNGRFARNGTRRRCGGMYGEYTFFRVIAELTLEGNTPITLDVNKVRDIVLRNKAAGTQIEFIDYYGVLIDKVPPNDTFAAALHYSDGDQQFVSPALHNRKHVRNGEITRGSGMMARDSLELIIFENGLPVIDLA